MDDAVRVLRDEGDAMGWRDRRADREEERSRAAMLDCMQRIRQMGDDFAALAREHGAVHGLRGGLRSDSVSPTLIISTRDGAELGA
jgi:hypothetical protein